MKVKDVMSFNPVCVEPYDTIRKAAKVMAKHDIGCVLVKEDEDIAGILTERDIVRAFAKGTKPGTYVKDVMTKGVITINQNARLEDAAKTMLRYNIKKLPVVDAEGVCVGIVTQTDLITYEERLIDKIATILAMKRKSVEGG